MMKYFGSLYASLISIGLSMLILSTAWAGGDPIYGVSYSAPQNASLEAGHEIDGQPQTMQNAHGREIEASYETSESLMPDEQGHAGQAEHAGGGQAVGFVAVEDDELVIDTDTLADGDGLGSLQVQWQISDDGSNWLILPGAVQPHFTPRDAEVGKYLRVQISYVDGQGNAEIMMSPASLPVRNVNDAPMGMPELLGDAREDGALTIDTSRIADEDGVGRMTLVWQRSSERKSWENFPDQFKESITLSQTDVGFSYRAVVSYIDGFGTRETLVSEPSEIVANIDNPVQGEAVVRGKPVEGSELTVNTSTLSDYDGIATMTMVWESSADGRTWDYIHGSEGIRNLALSQALVGNKIRSRVNVVDNFGVETVVYSQATESIRNVNNKPAGVVTIRRIAN